MKYKQWDIVFRRNESGVNRWVWLIFRIDSFNQSYKTVTIYSSDLRLEYRKSVVNDFSGSITRNIREKYIDWLVWFTM